MQERGYGFNNVYQELSVQNILSKVSDVTLWRYYLGMEFELRKNISSPLRKGDDDPSFNLYTNSRDRVVFKDHGGNGQGGDVFDFLCIRDSLSFLESLIRVNADFRLELGTPDQQTYGGCKPIGTRVEKQLEKFDEEFSVKNAAFIRVWTRSYTEVDYEYWKQYGISRETLEMYKVYCGDKVQVNGVLVYAHSTNNPCYVYYFPRSKHNKCYFPYTKDQRKRFLGSTNNYEDIQGYDQCEVKRGTKNDLLILTKSMKDVMTLRELGYNAMAIHGEGQYFYKDFIRHIKKYYTRIVSLYDRDRTGMKGAKYLWKEHKICPYFIHKSFGIKDISDMYKTVGRNKTEEFMKKISLVG